MSRPPSEHPKINKFLMLIDDETKDELNEMSELLCASRSEAARRGIHRLYQELKNRERSQFSQN